MRPSPLQLEGYIVTELDYRSQPGFKYDLENPVTTVAPADLHVEVHLSAHQEQPLRRSCELILELADPSGEKFPYIFRISLTGFYKISDKFPEGQVDLMFATNAPALLFSGARELIALVTGRGPYPAITLPSVTFLPAPAPAQPEQKAIEKKARKQSSGKKTTQVSKTSRKRQPA